MRKVSRAEEQFTSLNFRTANEPNRCSTPNCYKKPEDGASHCKDCADKVANQTSREDN